MESLPVLDPSQPEAVQSPIVVILGSGASVAACPNGDRHGRLLPVMTDLVERTGIASLITQLGEDPSANFEQTYSRLASSHRASGGHLLEIEGRIRGYFEQLRLPEHVTVYDKLLLSLRAKDIIASFNWDPLLLHALSRSRHLPGLPRVVFLHGSTMVGYCTKDRVKGHLGGRCASCKATFTPSPILFPIANKDYSSDPFIKNEWEEIRDSIHRAYHLTIFGYGAPQSDVAARQLLLDRWQSNSHLQFAQVELIDIAAQKDLKKKWRPFFVRDHYSIVRSFHRSDLALHPRRTCEALFAATMMLKPWASDPMPKFRRLESLHAWVEPYIREEELREFAGNPRAASGPSIQY